MKWVVEQLKSENMKAKETFQRAHSVIVIDLHLIQVDTGVQ